MRSRRSGWLTRIGLAGGAALLLTGCPEEAADIVEVKGTSLDFDVAVIAPIAVPTGATSRDRLLVLFNPSFPDAFGRATGALGLFESIETPFGPGFAFNVAAGFRNSSQDPRLPALQTGSASTGEFFGLFNPAWTGVGEGWWDLFGEVVGLAPNTTYTVALARMSLTVNGELDHQQVLLGSPVDQPDELSLLGGTEGGSETVVCNFSAGVAVTAADNPVALGTITTDADGAATVDCLPVAIGDSPWWRNAAEETPPGAADSVPVGVNAAGSVLAGQYNYILIIEGQGTAGNPVPDVNPTVRIQMGPDIDASGNVIDNAFAPFPAAAFTDQELADAPGSEGSRPDSVSIELFNVEEMAGGNVWQLWLVNRDEDPTTMVPAVGTYDKVAILRELDPITGEVISERDSVLETVTQISTLSGQLAIDLGGTVGEQEVKHRVTFSDAVSGETVGFFTDLLVTLEAGGAATVPSDAKALWVHYTDQNGTPADFTDDSPGPGTGVFGTFDPTTPRTFTAADINQSSGSGGVLDNEVSVEIRNLPRPPIGFYYEGWLVGPNNNRVSLGPVTSLPPDTVSLFDADIESGLPGVTATGIRFAVARAVLDRDAIVSPDFTVNLTSFFLTLEPKLGGPGKNVADLETGLLPTATIIDRMRRSQ